MPIYEYRCSACGYKNDYLQKHSDPLLSECPECGKSTFEKQVTAAGFQLKGTGWYATDFKNSGKSKPTAAKGEPAGGGSNDSGSSGGGSSSSGSSGGSGDGGSKPDVAASGAGACPACS